MPSAVAKPVRMRKSRTALVMLASGSLLSWRARILSANGGYCGSLGINVPASSGLLRRHYPSTQANLSLRAVSLL